MKFAWQKLSESYNEVTTIMGIHLISAYIIDSLQKLGLFRKWDKGVDINPDDQTPYTIQYQEAFLK